MITIIAGIVLLSIVVFIHELGHFLVARACRVKVKIFSIGFGPRLFGFKRGNTDYRVSAIPLGGYVKMLGDEITNDVSEEERRFGFFYQSIPKKIAIAFAGPLFNFLLPIILLFFVFIGSETVLKPVAGTVVKQGPAFVAGLLPEDEILSVNSKSISTFKDLALAINASPNQDLMLKVKRYQGDKAVIKDIEVHSKAYTVKDKLGRKTAVGRIGIMPHQQRPIVQVLSQPQSIKNFDEIIAVNGIPISSYPQLQKWLLSKNDLKLKIRRNGKILAQEIFLPFNNSQIKPLKLSKISYHDVVPGELSSKQLIKTVNNTKAILQNWHIEQKDSRGLSFIGTAISSVDKDTPAFNLGLKKDDQIISLDGKTILSYTDFQNSLALHPDDIHIIGVRRGNKAYTMAFRLKTVPSENAKLGALPLKVFGAKPMDNAYGPGETFTRMVGPLDAFSRSVKATWGMIDTTLQSIWMLITLKVPASQLGGPVMIFGIAGHAAEQGLFLFVFIMSLISVNLGILNLLPVPVLDGGHILMFSIEAIQRKPLSLNTRKVANGIGMMFLLFLMAFAFLNDLQRLLS